MPKYRITFVILEDKEQRSLESLDVASCIKAGTTRIPPINAPRVAGIFIFWAAL